MVRFHLTVPFEETMKQKFEDYLTESKITDGRYREWYTRDAMADDEIIETFGATPDGFEAFLENRLDITVDVSFFKVSDRKLKDNRYVEILYQQPALVNSMPSEMGKAVSKDKFKTEFKKWANEASNFFRDAKVKVVLADTYRTGSDDMKYRDHVARMILELQ